MRGDRVTDVLMTVKHHISAGHRIPGLPGAGAKCTNLHGHTFGIEWTFYVTSLDASEFEFTHAKELLRGWADGNLDHGYLCAPDDHELLTFLKVGGYKHYIVPPKPTTEALAMLLHQKANELLAPAQCVKVRIIEGPSNEAEVCCDPTG